MTSYKVFFTKRAAKDAALLSLKLQKKLQAILVEVIATDPRSGKKLLGDLAGNYSYRLDLKNRIIYSIDKKRRHIYVKRARTHYGE